MLLDEEKLVEVPWEPAGRAGVSHAALQAQSQKRPQDHLCGKQHSWRHGKTTEEVPWALGCGRAPRPAPTPLPLGSPLR